MRAYIYGRSALAVLRYLRGIADERVFDVVPRVRVSNAVLHKVSQLSQLSFESELLLRHAGEQLELLVFDKALVSQRKGLCYHLWGRPIPSGAFIRLNDELYLSSPAFIFLQLAQELNPFELALVGMELCGMFAKTGNETKDFRSRDVENRNVEFGLKPACSKRRIETLLKNVKGAWGAKQARVVASWITDNAASPMESAAYLLLTLPRKRGGYGLPQPALNPELRFRDNRETITRYPDLYWKSHSIDVEYQSDYAHTGNWRRYLDSKRQVLLTINDVTVLPLTRDQLMNVDDFHAFAHGLQKLLGIRKRPVSPDWEFQRAQLRKALLLSQV
ncbi:MAG: hypothetical protein IJ125_09795 [Atopobiaceae bacterium]|nr:hypothetical protein [Atopobiaceae bacterium]